MGKPVKKTVSSNRYRGGVTAVEMGGYVNLMDRTSQDILQLQNRFIGTNIIEQIKEAFKWRRQCELIQTIIGTKVDFLTAGFQHTAEQDKALNHYNNLAERFNFDKLNDELADDYLTCNNAVLTWKLPPDSEDPAEIEYIMTLDPCMVEYTNALGYEKLVVNLDDDLRDAICKMSEAERAQIPSKYVDAVLRGAGKVEFSNDDGEYWMVLSTNRRYRGFANPDMIAIFADLRLREMLIAGDWSAAFFAKAYLQLVQAGESISSGPLAGRKVHWLTKEAREKLDAIFKKIDKAQRIIGDHTLKISHIVPPKETFDGGKYGPVEARIFRWGGVAVVIIEGQGGAYAGGFIAKEKFIADIRRKRRMLTRFWEQFYRQSTIRGDVKLDKIPKIKWNEQLLKEPSQLLQEIKFLLTDGPGLSARTAFEQFGHDADAEWRRHDEEAKMPESRFRPRFEAKQGLLQEDDTDPGSKGEPGRPDKKGSQTEAMKRQRRPSRAGREIARQVDKVNWEQVYKDGGAHWTEDLQPSKLAQGFAQKLVELNKKNILEIGCGNGRDSILFALAGLKVTAIDVVPDAIQIAKENAEKADVVIDFQVGNAEKLSFNDGSFDAVFSISVLHATNMGKSIPEISRILKKKGIALIYIYSNVEKIDGTTTDFVKVDEFIDLLKASGFKVSDFYTNQDNEFDESGEKHMIIVTEISK